MERYCGKEWSKEDLELVRGLIRNQPRAHRRELSRLVCEMFDWRGLDGRLKEMSCRVAMVRMHRDGLIILPAPRTRVGGPYRLVRTAAGEPAQERHCSVEELSDLRVELVGSGKERQLWNEFIGRYHYLGYKMLPGAQLRYFIKDGERYLGAFGFGAAAWHVASRDKFIGWSFEERQKQLHLIANQARFLILPWVHCRNLATKSLRIVESRLPNDWESRYGYRPVLMETFVEVQRFPGTCYKAGGWQMVGVTKGRGKLDRSHAQVVPVKSVWLKPLTKDFRQRLCGMKSR